jgi:hypothetical protein
MQGLRAVATAKASSVATIFRREAKKKQGDIALAAHPGVVSGFPFPLAKAALMITW